jgi:hypothetical protein
MSLIKHIQKLNQIYDMMTKNYRSLEKMFNHHSTIKQKIILSEQFLYDAFKLIVEKTEETQTKRQFNHIVKDIKEKYDKSR